MPRATRHSPRVPQPLTQQPRCCSRANRAPVPPARQMRRADANRRPLYNSPQSTRAANRNARQQRATPRATLLSTERTPDEQLPFESKRAAAQSPMNPPLLTPPSDCDASVPTSASTPPPDEPKSQPPIMLISTLTFSSQHRWPRARERRPGSTRPRHGPSQEPRPSWEAHVGSIRSAMQQ